MKTGKRFFVLILLTITNIFLVNGQKQLAKEVLNQSAMALKERKSFSYDAKYRFKFFDQDTITTYPVYNCQIVKAPQDTIVGFYARIANENEERIYDGSDFNIIWHKSKEIQKDTPALNGKKFIINNIKKEYIPIFLYAENPFKYYLNNGFNWKLSDTIIGTNKAWKVELLLPPNEEITFIKKIICIDKKSSLPIAIQGSATYKDIQSEYSELALSNYGSNILNLGSIQADKLPETYKIIEHKPIQNKISDIKLGTKISKIKTVDNKGNQQIININDNDKGIVLLDFWYFGCTPCLKAMPKLNNLYNKYKNEGLSIYGLNPFDNAPNKIEVINKFINKSDIQYPILFIEKELVEEYEISVYPTIFILKKGQIIHSIKGNSENDFNTLTDIIVSNLKTN